MLGHLPSDVDHSSSDEQFKIQDLTFSTIGLCTSFIDHQINRTLVLSSNTESRATCQRPPPPAHPPPPAPLAPSPSLTRTSRPKRGPIHPKENETITFTSLDNRDIEEGSTWGD
mmetsp:Transcript_420/g.541  ORF Transcript_420/g.541 Transcript_420/m.541 type:complete len:114 (-) Transcript_420:94-435(-)